ncbi:10377_t:CDS:2, partial [Funneliformis geosporum]
MANKIQNVEEYDKSLNDLDIELDNIQKCAVEIFHKIDNSFSYPYPIGSVSAELNVLLSAIQHFEKKAKSLGVSSLTTTDIKIQSNEP